MMKQNIGIIIVTHNSQGYLEKCLTALAAGSLQPARIIIVDSGSIHVPQLPLTALAGKIEVIYSTENIGYAAANNLGFDHLRGQVKYVLFLNPDAFCLPDTLEQAQAALEKPGTAHFGALTGKLLGYHFQRNEPTDCIDSTGIFYTKYGHFFDRDQGRSVRLNSHEKAETIPIACGAFLFCRMAAVEAALLRGREVFDEDFFMYKEDIDFSFRLRNSGCAINYEPAVQVYHCRGWNSVRRQVPFWARRLSLKNDWRLWRKFYLSGSEQVFFFCYLLAKSIYIFCWERWRGGKQ